MEENAIDLVDCNNPNKIIDGFTSLDFAIKFVITKSTDIDKHKQIIISLLNNGADINSCDSKGLTVLNKCCSEYYIKNENNGFTAVVDIIYILLEYGADPNISCIYDYTPIYNICKKLHHTPNEPNLLYILDILCKSGANPLTLTILGFNSFDCFNIYSFNYLVNEFMIYYIRILLKLYSAASLYSKYYDGCCIDDYINMII